MEDEEYVRVVDLIKGEFSVEEDLLLIDLLEQRRFILLYLVLHEYKSTTTRTTLQLISCVLFIIIYFTF